MNPYTLHFLDDLLERDYKLSRRSSSAKTLFLIYALIMFLQLLGLLILANDESSMQIIIIWAFVPILTLIITQIMLRRPYLFEFGIFLQRMEVTIYLMELVFCSDDYRKTFLLGLVANCLYLNWGEGGSWISFSFQVVLSYTYYLVRISPDASGPANIILYLIVVGFLVGNFHHQEKVQRRRFYKLQKLAKEKQFWRNFIENTYQEPCFILKLNNSNRAKTSLLSIKTLIKKKLRHKKEPAINLIGTSPVHNNVNGSYNHIPHQTTPENGCTSNVKLLKRLEYSLGLSNTASRNKLSVFTKEDLVELFRSSDLVSTDFRNDQPLLTFEEVLSQMASLPAVPFIQNIKEKIHDPFYFMSVNNKQSPFKKAKIYVGLIAGSKSTKNLEILVTIHVVEFEEELEKLKELDKAKDKILANVTHDLRSPLNGIMNFLDEAMEIQDMEERNKLLEYAKINSDLLLNLINDILDLSQYKEGKLRIGLSSFGVIRLAEEVLKLMEFKAVSKGVKLFLCTNLKEEKICESDPKRLKQVLINLISNSLKFTSKGFIRLVINSTPYKNVLKFEVYDTGCGIKKDQIQKLFNPYVTFSESGNNNYGIGLGLSICQSIVQLLGPSEKLFVSSQYGKGTKIGFLFFSSHDKTGSLPKNSLNLSDKSVIISKEKDSAIIVTTGQKNGSPKHFTSNKGTPNFVKSTLNSNSRIESNIFSKFQRSGEKKATENPENFMPQSTNPENQQQFKSASFERPGIEGISPTLGLKKPSSIHLRNRGITHMMEGWGINRTMTIKNTDMKPIEFPVQLPQNPTIVGQSLNSSSILSRSMRLNCSEYFTTFSLLEAESMQGFEVGQFGKSYEFLQDRDDSSNMEKWSNEEIEELEDGAQINKPISFFQEEPLSFFSNESENNRHLLSSAENMKKIEDGIVELTKKEIKIKPDEKKVEKNVENRKEPSFGERSLALKNVRLEKIEEEANEESKQDLKTSNNRQKSKSKKAFTFIERSPKVLPEPDIKHSLNVLVVDDDPFNTMIICRFLEKLNLPLKIDKGSNGQEALDLFKLHNRKNESQKAFHIVFLDCQMPIMTGYEASKNIKECIKTGGYENCVVIAITAYNIQDEEEKCMLAGMDAVLMKPVSEWEFRELVNKFLVYEGTHTILP